MKLISLHWLVQTQILNAIAKVWKSHLHLFYLMYLIICKSIEVRKDNLHKEECQGILVEKEPTSVKGEGNPDDYYVLNKRS